MTSMQVDAAGHRDRGGDSVTQDARQGHRTEYPADFPVTLSRTGESFTVAVRQSVRAADLLALEQCTAPCLLAREDGECICRCGGEFHGALTEAEVTLDPAQWHTKAVLRTPRRDPEAISIVARHQLRALPLTGPASVLRLQVAMLAWDCGATEAAQRLGLSRSTVSRALREGIR
jgi:hypothetical protein